MIFADIKSPIFRKNKLVNKNYIERIEKLNRKYNKSNR